MHIDGKPWVPANYPHIRIPKLLLSDQRYHMLSPEAIVTYAAMMDRTNLSKKNQNKFKNDKNEIYIYYPQNEIMALLRCGHDKATKVLKELVDAKLIKVQRRGIGRPYEIVLIPIDWRPLRKNKNEQSGKSLQDSEKTDHSLRGKTDRNNTDVNNTESSKPEYYIRNYLKNEIGYGELICNYDPTLIDRILNVAVNALSQEAESFCVGNNPVRADLVKEKLRNLRKEHILFVIRKIKNATYTTDYSDIFILNALCES